MPKIDTEIDSRKLDSQLAAKQDEVKRANLAMISAIRQTAQAGILVLQVAGVAINQIFTLYVESLLVGIEVAAAISVGTFGLSQIFQIGQIIGMLLLIRQIQQKKRDAAKRTNAAIMLLRMGTYR